MTDWLNDRQRDGGIDRIPLPTHVPGTLWLCGKHAVATRYADGHWDTIVCLTERHEIAGHYPDYVAWLDGGVAIWQPIHDLHAPPLGEMQALVDRIAVRLGEGDRVLMHCAAGKGRAGTTAVCLLVALGHDLDEALRIVATARPGAGPEAGVQLALVHEMGASPHG